jgi:hypothetical protein
LIACCTANILISPFIKVGGDISDGSKTLIPAQHIYFSKYISLDILVSGRT